MSKNEMIIEIEKMLIIPQPYYRICIDSLRDAHMHLKEPTLPAVPSDAVLGAITVARGNSSVNIQGNRKVYDAIRAALLTPPKPKMKTVWYFTAKLNDDLRLYTHSSESEAVANRELPLRSIARGDKRWSHVSPIWSEVVEDK